MKDNQFRSMLNEGKPTVGTRIWSTWPVITETCASTGVFDYVDLPDASVIPTTGFRTSSRT